MKKQNRKYRTPAQLLCEAIDKKLPCFCGGRPDAYIFVPGGFLECDLSEGFDYRRMRRIMRNGLKIVIALRFGESGAYLNSLYYHKIFYVHIAHCTDHTNIIREQYIIPKNEIQDRYHIYSNIFVAPCQVQSFVKEFLTYLHFGEISLRTISWEDSCAITTSSLLSPPPKSMFFRWLAFARM